MHRLARILASRCPSSVKPAAGATDHDALLEDQIAELADRPTHELRLSWRKLYHREPPLGLSRDLMIRVLANKMQERAYART
jgi:hypothetical protein